MPTLVTEVTCSISSLLMITLTEMQFIYYIATFEILVVVRLGFRSCQINKSKYDDSQVRACVIHHRCSFLCQSSSLRMVDIPYRRCHRCSVTDNQLYYPRVIRIAALKVIAAIIHLRVSFFLVSWVCYRDVCRENKNKGSNK